jgi:hypothetical protein
MMAGRWTLQRCNGCGRVAVGRAGTEWCHDTERMETQTPVPVVPCDDAAVERVARVLCSQHGYSWDDAGDGLKAALVAAADQALRAAGEAA